MIGDLLTAPEAAEVIRKSVRFVKDEYRRGNLRGFKYGGALHFSRADLEAYVLAHANVTPVARRKRRAS